VSVFAFEKLRAGVVDVAVWVGFFFAGWAEKRKVFIVFLACSHIEQPILAHFFLSCLLGFFL
jgi:hypothetical protein